MSGNRAKTVEITRFMADIYESYPVYVWITCPKYQFKAENNGFKDESLTF